MERLLTACAGLQLLHTHTRDGEACYSNTEDSRIYLTKSSPKSLYHSIQYSSNTIYLCWHYLTDAVREGKNQYEKAFGVSSSDLFEALYRSDEEMIKFMQLMNSVWNICGRDVVTAFDLSPFKSIYDLGGCSGALAKQCVSAYPETTVTIFDLPKVVQTAKEHFVPTDERRISFHEGDFFRDALPEADLYILARILHDWTDVKSLELLTKVHHSCRPGVRGGAIHRPPLFQPQVRRGRILARLYSLNMLVQTEGKERSPSEYSRLLSNAGFTHIQVRRTGKIYDAILARK
ncbi:ASMT methyltransferase, partial [Amia calva]|nr:ASMT methyltransferase [Amia calva]